MNITEQQLVELREQIQEDLLCLLDGFDEELQEKACQIVVDNVNNLFS